MANLYHGTVELRGKVYAVLSSEGILKSLREIEACDLLTADSKNALKVTLETLLNSILEES